MIMHYDVIDPAALHPIEPFALSGCISHFAGFIGSAKGRSGKAKAEPLHQVCYERLNFFLEAAFHLLISLVFPENIFFHLKSQSLLYKVA